MQLITRTWQEAEDYLKTSRGILVPIGSTEQHGPNGLLGTDYICAEGIARGVGTANGALVGPPIPIGMALHHMGFPGTISLRPSTLLVLVRDYVLSLAEHGFERILFVNGHGGNVPTLNAAFYEAYAEWTPRVATGAKPLRCRHVNWWQHGPVQALARELFGAGEGRHATASEVAVTQYLLPESIKTAPLDPPRAPDGPIYSREDFRRRFPDGRIGSDPSLASPEAGRLLYQSAVDSIAAMYRDFLAEA